MDRQEGLNRLAASMEIANCLIARTAMLYEQFEGPEPDDAWEDLRLAGAALGRMLLRLDLYAPAGSLTTNL